MKYFQTTRKLYELSGIFSPQQQQDSSLSVQIHIFFIVMILSFIQTIEVLFIAAKSIFEYGTSFYAAVTLLLMISSYALNAWNRMKMFTIIEKFDAFIEKST